MRNLPSNVLLWGLVTWQFNNHLLLWSTNTVEYKHCRIQFNQHLRDHLNVKITLDRTFCYFASLNKHIPWKVNSCWLEIKAERNQFLNILQVLEYRYICEKPFVSPEGAAWSLINHLWWCHLSQCQLGLKTTSFDIGKKMWSQKLVSLPELCRPLISAWDQPFEATFAANAK